MSTLIRIPAAAAVLTLAAVASLAARQDAGDKPAPKRLTHQSLLERLKGLGHEPKIVGKDPPRNQLAVDLDGYKATFDVWLSKNEANFWMTTNSAALPKPEAVPADVILEMLRVNREIHPLQITLEKSSRIVFLQRLTPNRDVQPKELRQMIEEFAAAEKKTNHLRLFAVLQPPPAVSDTEESAKLRQAIKGAWTVESRTEDGKTEGAAENVGALYTFEGKQLRFSLRKTPINVALKPGEDTFHMDLFLDLVNTQFCLAKLENDQLTLCLSKVNGKRPESFAAEKDSGAILLKLKRK